MQVSMMTQPSGEKPYNITYKVSIVLTRHGWWHLNESVKLSPLHQKKTIGQDIGYYSTLKSDFTVNLEIFAIILFLRVVLKGIFAT